MSANRSGRWRVREQLGSSETATAKGANRRVATARRHPLQLLSNPEFYGRGSDGTTAERLLLNPLPLLHRWMLFHPAAPTWIFSEFRIVSAPDSVFAAAERPGKVSRKRPNHDGGRP